VAQEPLPPPDSVVTLTAALGADEPFASIASTVKLYVVDADSPLTVNVVPVEVPTEDPFSRMA
jgi:hypothetical protein